MPDVSIADLPAQIAMALSLASSSTGTDYHYLMSTARTESSFQTEARAPTSSATGLFQFIEETWIRTVKDEGPRFGLGQFADMITKTPAGHYSVDTPEHRAAILKLRTDAKISAMMAAAYARQNAEFVRNAIGRKPTSDELYMAHFLGPADAVRLITYRDSQPSLSAPDLFPAAARANRNIFFGEAGARSVGQVYDVLAARAHGGETTVADNGAFFAGNIDFGSWTPTVEKIYNTRLPGKRVAALSTRAVKSAVSGESVQLVAASDGNALFDFFSGGPAETTSAAAPATEATSDGWGAQVDTAGTRETPFVTVADDYPTDGQGLLAGAEAANETVTQVSAKPADLAANPGPIRIAAADPQPTSRLKIIHVPQQ